MERFSEAQAKDGFGGDMVEAAIESAVNAILIIDEAGLILKVNPSCEAMFGFNQAELIGRNVKILMPEPDRAAHDRYMHSYMQTGRKKIIGIGRQVRGRRKDGADFLVHLSVGEFRSGGKRYFIGTINDLSAQEAAEAESERQRILFEAIFDNCPEAMIIADAGGRIRLFNPAATRIFEYPAAELAGKETRALFARTADYERIAGLVTEAEQLDRQGGVLVSLARRSGESFPGAAAAARIVDEKGFGHGVLTIIRDISKEVAQEQALRQVQRMEALGQLTGGIAHDFNNLLTIITGNLELLDFEIEDGYHRDLLKRASDAAHMGARLTGRLLTFARRRPLDAVFVNLNDLLLGIMDLLRRTLGETISISSSLAPDLWPVRSDVSEIENAAVNLAINARDAMPSGGKLMIETRNIEIEDHAFAGDLGLAPGRYVRLSVSDTGQGIPLDILPRVFEPFFTTKAAGKGTGLGLSVIYGFAKQSGGQITIYSEPGRGTTVNLYLPQAGETSGKSVAGERAEPPRAEAGELIMVVEDQAPVREVTMKRLEQLGYAVREAESAAEALERLRAGETADLIFSDIVMPGGMTGFDLAAWVRANRPDIPVVLTSGFAENAAQHLAEGETAAAILRKPYSGGDLAEAIRAALDARRHARPVSGVKT